MIAVAVFIGVTVGSIFGWMFGDHTSHARYAFLTRRRELGAPRSAAKPEELPF